MTVAGSAANQFVPSASSFGVLAFRALLRLTRIPALIVPTILMPAFFIIAFSGSFSGITNVDGYPTDNVVNWVAAFAILQTASLTGMGAAGALAADLESGFLDRLLATPVRRIVILGGPLGQVAIRALIPITVIMVISAAKDASMPAGLLGIVMAYVGGVGTGLVLGCLGLAVVLRIANIRAMAIVQVAGFMVLFPSTGQVPIGLMDGWLKAVAEINPATNLLRMTRQGFLGDVTWADTWPGLVVLAIGLLVFGSWARWEIGRMNR